MPQKSSFISLSTSTNHPILSPELFDNALLMNFNEKVRATSSSSTTTLHPKPMMMLRKRNYPLLAYDSVFYIPEQLFLTRGVIVATTRPNGPAVGVVAMLGCPSSKNMATILSKNR
jgi:hypothetical protein